MRLENVSGKLKINKFKKSWIRDSWRNKVKGK